jgi:hypothetical protein
MLTWMLCPRAQAAVELGFRNPRSRVRCQNARGLPQSNTFRELLSGLWYWRHFLDWVALYRFRAQTATRTSSTSDDVASVVQIPLVIHFLADGIPGDCVKSVLNAVI